MVHGHAEGVKTGCRLDGGFMKRMPGPALAGLKRLDARSPKTGYGTGDSSIDLPIASLRLLIGHARAYPPVSDLGGTNRPGTARFLARWCCASACRALSASGGAVRRAGREREDAQATPAAGRERAAVGRPDHEVLAPCQEYGAERLAVRIVAADRNTGVAGLPEDDDWTAWNADEMRAAVEHLQRKRGALAPRR